MKQNYVVLRMPKEMVNEGVTAVLAGTRGATAEFDVRDVKVETQTLSTKDIADIQRDPETLAAPEMPVQLVEPMQQAAADAEAGARDDGPIAWGVKATKAHSSALTGKGVVVAILDTGIEKSHEAFKGREASIVQKDFTKEGDGDGNGHGTHCAGTVFGGDVGGVRIGIAQGIEKALIGKVLNKKGRGSTAQIFDGILWAVREGANVVSMSLALDFPALVKSLVEEDGMDIRPATSKALAAYRDNVRLFDSLATLVAAQSHLFTKSMLVAAAGNESKRPTYEINTAPPATADGFLSVGAVNSKLGVASFSNALPDVAAPGVDIRSAAIGGGLTSMDGTSMATPHVVGVAALWVEKIMGVNPAFKASELRNRLVGNASHDGVPVKERANVGAGCVVAPQAL